MKNKLKTVLLSAFAGAANGFLGSGAGVVFVNTLLENNLSQRRAQATALLAVLPSAVLSALVYILTGNVDWGETLWITVGVTLGAAVGACLLNVINDKTAKIIYSCVLVAGGIKLLFSL